MAHLRIVEICFSPFVKNMKEQKYYIIFCLLWYNKSYYFPPKLPVFKKFGITLAAQVRYERMATADKPQQQALQATTIALSSTDAG